MALVRKRLGEILIEAGMITEDQLGSALEKQKTTKQSIGQILVDLSFVTENNIKDALELQFGISYVNVKGINMTADLLDLIPENVIRQRQLIPINFTNNRLTVAMVNPQDLPALDDVRLTARQSFGKSVNVHAVVITEDDFYSFVDQHFADTSSSKPGAVGISLEENFSALEIVGEMDVEEIDEDLLMDDPSEAEAAPIVRLANAILANAIKKKASDIHIEPQEKYLRLRYRVDGVLSEEPRLPRKITNALASRFKIITNLDIAEKRLPQDGRLRRRIGGRNIDFRVSTLPSKHGEKIVMRILDNSNTTLGLEKLFVYPEMLETIRELVSRPYGIIFVTGPTGSGKTTSLYSILAERNTVDVNITTAEDPIEYDLEGIIQCQALPDIGLTFARILKAFLRQDPDIMLIGETRDKALAKIAIESALTGHLVFTSLHTNDAPGAITRLQEMGVDGFLIASATICVLAQRLVRRLCDCKIEYTPESKVLDYVGFMYKPDEEVRLWKHNPDGCGECNKGYKGRMGCYELMVINDELRDLINRNANKAMIRFAAKENGMETLKDFSLRLVRDGITDLDEVMRVTMTDEGQESVCPNCRNAIEETFIKCPFCQVDLKKMCPGCEREVEEGWKACPTCGTNLLNTDKKISVADKAASSPSASAAPTEQATKSKKKTKASAVELNTDEDLAQCPTCLATVQPEWKTCPYCYALITTNEAAKA